MTDISRSAALRPTSPTARKDGRRLLGALALWIGCSIVSGAASGAPDRHATHAAMPRSAHLTLTSSAFGSHQSLPDSVIAEYLDAGVNYCTADGSTGGDTSPPLSWTNVPAGTQSFVVTLYDTVASFTHWGIYNIPGDATSLPSSAGAPDSTAGDQIDNDGGTVGYTGPCP